MGGVREGLPGLGVARRRGEVLGVRQRGDGAGWGGGDDGLAGSAGDSCVESTCCLASVPGENNRTNLFRFYNRVYESASRITHHASRIMHHASCRPCTAR